MSWWRAWRGGAPRFSVHAAAGRQRAGPRRPALAGRRAVTVAVSGEATTAALVAQPRGRGLRRSAAGQRLAADLVADAADLLRTGRPAGAVRVVAMAAIADPAGAEALRLGLADLLLRRPVVQAEWRDVVARLRRDGPSAPPPRHRAVRPAALPPRRSPGSTSWWSTTARSTAKWPARLWRGSASRPTPSTSGSEALAAVAARRFDLVLMDGSMPDMDGYETTRLLRQREAGAAPRPDRRRHPLVRVAARSLRRFRTGATGAAAVEFAILGLTFTMVLCFIVEIGMTMLMQSTLSEAARSASRLIMTAASSNPEVSRCRSRPHSAPRCGCSWIAISSASTSSRATAFRAAGLRPDRCRKPARRGECSPGAAQQDVVAQVGYTRSLYFPILKDLIGTQGKLLLVSIVVFQNEPY